MSEYGARTSQLRDLEGLDHRLVAVVPDVDMAAVEVCQQPAHGSNAQSMKCVCTLATGGRWSHTVCTCAEKGIATTFCRSKACHRCKAVLAGLGQMGQKWREGCAPGLCGVQVYALDAIRALKEMPLRIQNPDQLRVVPPTRGGPWWDVQKGDNNSQTPMLQCCAGVSIGSVRSLTLMSSRRGCRTQRTHDGQ